MKDLSQILKDIMGRNETFKRKEREYSLLNQWDKVVGARLAQHTKPLYVTQEGVLLVATESSIWSHQLKFLERQIIERVKKDDPQSRVVSIRFIVKTDLQSL